MLDTISAIFPPSQPLPDTLFKGGQVMTDFDREEVNARLWLNPGADDGYHPRVTYWRSEGVRSGAGLMDYEGVPSRFEDTGLLKIEFSVPKMLGDPISNPSVSAVQQALDDVTAFMREHFDAALPPVQEWKAKRVDYAWNWTVGKLLPAYMAVLQKLRLKTYSRHPFGADEGVVWKSRSVAGRWVKFYNKSREQGLVGDDAILRFEVSNYRDAVRYMGSEWFGLDDRTVGEMVKPSRAVFVLCKMWDDLGLGTADSYGHDELLHYRLRDAFGTRGVAQALYALNLIADYGTSAYGDDLALTTKSSYYLWRRKLKYAGFLLTTPDGSEVVERVSLPPLHLPVSDIVAPHAVALRCHLSAASSSPDVFSEKIPPEFWPDLARLLEINPDAKPSAYLLERSYATTQNLARSLGADQLPEPAQPAAGAADLPGDDGDWRSRGQSDRDIVRSAHAEPDAIANGLVARGDHIS